MTMGGGETVGDWVIIVKAAIIIKADEDCIINLLNLNCDIFTWSFNNISLLSDATSAPFMSNKRDSTLHSTQDSFCTALHEKLDFVCRTL